MKKILLIDDSDTYTWCLQKYLQHRGYPVKTACTLKKARAAIQEEMPLVVCCDLNLPDGSGMDFLDEVRAADKELPFILASCHDKDDYEKEAKRRGATLCIDKMKGLLQDKLVEYAYRQLSGEKAPTFHKLLFVHAENPSAGVLRAAMLQKGFNLIMADSLCAAERRLIEDKEIELVLCDLELTDGTAMKLLHDIRRITDAFKDVENPPMKLLPFFILTENKNLSLEYQYRCERVNDYFVAPINIPELMRRILYFLEPQDT